MVDIKQKILSKLDLYYGFVNMPKGFEINREVLSKSILEQIIKQNTFPFSKDWDKLNTYLREHINVEFNISLVNKENNGFMFKPDHTHFSENEVDKIDLKNSPDYVMLYGVDVKSCNVRIYYDDNRRAGRYWDITLDNNKFIIFPSTLLYKIDNYQKDKLNFILKTTYEYI